jgi:S-methylmethionine-dependent homocysteine/selenocysteine methylase
MNIHSALFPLSPILLSSIVIVLVYMISMNSHSERTKRAANRWFLPLADISERELLEEHYEKFIYIICIIILTSDLYSLQVSNVEHKIFENTLRLRMSRIVKKKKFMSVRRDAEILFKKYN